MSKQVTPNRLAQAKKQINENTSLKNAVSQPLLEKMEKISEKEAQTMFYVLQIGNQKIDNANIQKNASLAFYYAKNWHNRKVATRTGKKKEEQGKLFHLKKMFAHVIIVHDPTLKKTKAKDDK